MAPITTASKQRINDSDSAHFHSSSGVVKIDSLVIRNRVGQDLEFIYEFADVPEARGAFVIVIRPVTSSSSSSGYKIDLDKDDNIMMNK